MLGRLAAILEVEAEDENPNETEPGEKPAPPSKPSAAVKAAVSSTPAPIRPLRKPAPASTGLNDDLSVDEWLRRRNAQLRKK